MHAEPPPGPRGDENPNQAPGSGPGHQGPWYRGLTRYHWFVLAVASLGWLFDTMDQQLFNLARTPALSERDGGLRGGPQPRQRRGEAPPPSSSSAGRPAA